MAAPVSNRLTSADVLLSPVTEADLPQIAAGYYAAFPQDWHDMMEPLDRRPALDIRIARMAARMRPWIGASDGKYVKATLRSDPSRIIGHAGWLRPSATFPVHHWRKDAGEKLGWKEKYAWSEEEEKDMWEHVDVEKWQGLFEHFDGIKKELMGGEPHWFLAPLWVLPEFQHRGVSSLLLKDVLDEADAHDPPIPAFLEATDAGRPVYEHFGFEAVQPSEGHEMQMIRRGPAPKGV